MMNDRFKFRVWCKERKEWEKDQVAITNKENYIINFSDQNLTRVTDIDPIQHEINFCTGLKDKNDKLIYEGDIVEFSSDFNGRIRGIVYYDEMGLQIKAKLFCSSNFSLPYADRDFKYFYDQYFIKVIGNKYENPELLKECK